jgi:hypothetical protein
LPSTDPSQTQDQSTVDHDDGDLTDLLGELRVLLPGAQTLTAFLIILPFNSGFAEIRDVEKTIYLITFLCSILALILFTAPAAQHRLQRPLLDREGFKNIATKYVIAGLVPLSIALVLVTQLVLSEVIATRWVSWAVAGALALVILALWWVVPTVRHTEQKSGRS